MRRWALLTREEKVVSSSRVTTPRLPTRASRACSTSTVARASCRARWSGVVAAPNSWASVDELAVGRLVTGHQLAGQVRGVDHLEAGPLVAGAGRRRLEEADVEGRVVRHQHGVAGELEERRQDAVDARGVGDHAVGDAGEDGDERRDRLGRVDQRLELAEHLAAADLDRADLGDVAPAGAAAGGLEVDHDEGDRRQRGAELVECSLDAVHGRNRRCRRRQDGAGAPSRPPRKGPVRPFS